MTTFEIAVYITSGIDCWKWHRPFTHFRYSTDDRLVICVFFVYQAICTEAGLMALRERRMKVTNEDFKKSKENVLYRKNEGTPEGLYL